MLNIGASIDEWRNRLFDLGLPGARNADRWMLAAAIIMIVAATILRLGLADYSPWYDEFASLHFAGLPTATLWSRQAVIETNPPLFYSLLGLWEELGARSVVPLRSLPILSGTLSLALIVFICQRWLSARAAVIAVLLMGLSAQHIYYSHLLRAYILMLDGVLLSIIGLLLIVHRTQRRDVVIGWALHVAGSSLGIYCHTTMFLWPAIAALSMMAFCGRDLFADRAHLFVGLVVANLAIVAITSWWLWITYLQLSSGAETIAWMKPIGLHEYIRRILAGCMLAFDHYDRDKFATNVFALLTIASGVALWRDRTGRFLVMLALASIIVFGVAGALKPIIMQRTIFWMSSFAVLLISGALGSLRSSWARYGAVTACVGLLVANLADQAPKFQQQDWRGSVSKLAADQNAVLIVQGEGMGLNVPAACVLLLHTSCPFPVFVLPVDRRSQGSAGWASRGSAKVMSPRNVRRRIAADRNVYALNTLGYDPLKALGLAALGHTEDGEPPFLVGPFPASIVTSAEGVK